jgi:cytochrome c553
LILSIDTPFFATWEFEVMKFVAAIVCSLALAMSGSVFADAAAGKSAFAARGCIGCHGAGGVSVVPTYPSLKGRSAAFVSKNLTDFRSGARKNPTMNAMAAGLSDADIKNLADYIGSLK